MLSEFGLRNVAPYQILGFLGLYVALNLKIHQSDTVRRFAIQVQKFPAVVGVSSPTTRVEATFQVK